MMQRDEQQVANPIVFDDNEAGNGEIGTLSLITQQRIIRRAYLNNKIIPTQVDTCSLVSIVESNDPKFNRILKIRRKLNTHPLSRESQRMEEYHANKLAIDKKLRPKL